MSSERLCDKLIRVYKSRKRNIEATVSFYEIWSAKVSCIEAPNDGMIDASCAARLLWTLRGPRGEMGREESSV